MRVGCGYDSHRLVAGRRLVLGGVDIPFERGLDGWSDADVLTHAVIDALCGAVGLGDIGTLFPPGDPRYQGVSSLRLLETVVGMVRERNMSVVNVDVTVLAEEPRLSPYAAEMRRRLADVLRIADDCVSVKAKTNERMGFVGRGEGIAAFAVASVALAGM
ncbi:MAG: 2-C-methyl-D-erythritol 2,4-cyclodiphosphate synthase [Dehalococcoidia bacterium]|nr:2-C-methyl-D-erythritol 2,4-cyclodiphosphate synthase [Dehalococcoidia bacterium]